MSHRPTAEQAAIVDASTTGQDLVVEAGAGTGKTSTLKLLAQANGRRRGLYLAYNRAIKEDAAKSFPRSVQCRTSHGLAYGAVANRYRHRLGGGRVPAFLAVRILRINEPIRLTADLAPLAPQQLARLAVGTVDRYCHSADDDISAWHVPRVNGMEASAVRADLARAVVPLAQRVWADLTTTDGGLRFTHDSYLKIYQLSRPRLSFDYLLVDEAQDLNPVVQAIIGYQTDAQIVMVGDRCQSIYGWRGAVDAMATATGQRFYLSQSFRFGNAIAHEANKWLSLLDSPLRLRGYSQIPSTVGIAEQPDAILCRSNAGALARVMEATDAGRRTALVGGGGDLSSLAKAAEELQRTGSTQHPELCAFTSWQQVQEYCALDESGSDLGVLVGLIDKHGTETIVRTVEQLVEERDAEVVISTAHKAKGREWPAVQIATDFREPRPDPETGLMPDLPRDEAMLAYVAVTRAQRRLDRMGLAWVDQWVNADRIDRPSAAALLEDADALERHLRQIAVREVPPAVVAAAVDIDWPAPVPVAQAAAEHLHACRNPACRGEHLDAAHVGDCSQPGWVDRTWSGVELGQDCRRCKHPYWECTCTLMPDRRPLTAAATR